MGHRSHRNEWRTVGGPHALVFLEANQPRQRPCRHERVALEAAMNAVIARPHMDMPASAPTEGAAVESTAINCT
jgi:hypothetical protein